MIGDVTYDQVKLTGFQNNMVKFTHAVGTKSVPLVVLTQEQVEVLNRSNDKVVIKAGAVDLTPPSPEAVRRAVALIQEAGAADGLLPNGNTPLIEAAGRGDDQMVRALIARDADVNVRTVTDQTAIGAAAAGSHASVMRLLRAAGARAPDLMVAILSGDVPTVNERISKDKKLLKAVDRDGMTPLMRASIENQPEVVSALLALGASANETGMTHGRTPLMLAASAGHNDVVSVLLSRGANLQARDQSGWTALMHAADAGRLDTVRALLQKKPDVNLSGKGGETALSLARARGHIQVAELLTPPPAPPKLLEVAPAKPAKTAAAKPAPAKAGSVAPMKVEPIRVPGATGSKESTKERGVPGWVYMILFLAAITYIVGNFWMIGVAWHESIGWAIMMFLFNPIPNIIYFFMNIQETKTPFMLLCIGTIGFITAMVIGGLFAA